MNLKQLLNNAGIRNDIQKEVQKKVAKTTAEQELEHQEKALALTKVMINEALKGRKSQEGVPTPLRSILLPNEK